MMSFPNQSQRVSQAFLILLLTLLSTAVVPAQERLDLCTSRKFALYNEMALAGKDGVERLHKAYENSDNIGDFFGTLDPEKRKKLYENQRLLVLEPVLNEVRDSIQKIGLSSQIALADGWALDESGVLAAFDKSLDVTETLTKILNLPPAERSSKIKLEVRASEIGTIDAIRFAEAQSGRLTLKSVDWERLGSCTNNKECERILDHLTKYLQAHKLGAIFSVTPTSVERFTGPNCRDITKDFIESSIDNSSDHRQGTHLFRVKLELAL
jgi:hypothetical protein